MATKSNAAAAFRRNLAALSLDDDSEETLPELPASSSNNLSNYSVKQIPFDLLEPNRFQVKLRPKGSPEEQIREKERLHELAENMAVNGFTSVILVRPHPEQPGHYEVGHGHRRLAALKLAATLDVEPNKVRGITKIPSRIAESATDAEWLDIAISENLSREDLTPLAIANSFEAIRGYNPGISLAEIARRVGRSKSWVQRYDAINGAPPHLVDMIREKPDSIEHLNILKRDVKDQARQRELAHQIIKGQLTLGALQEQVKLNKVATSYNRYKGKDIDTDSSLASNSGVSRLINQIEANIIYLHRELERKNYDISFDQQDKLEQMVLKLKELISITRPSSK